ncbi:short transient receptor potential channel 4-like [Diadema antillarum]|uniref:short transient receptor potential channel 4-like n=1 Tax=Diadema antillarum TaxID=105358 RepID=UPI003A8AAC3F
MASDEEPLSGQEAYFQAAASGEVATLKALLDKRNELGIDLNAKNEDGYTAMQLAVLEGYVVVIKELLACDVKVGDALLRAADVEFELAVKCILEHALKKPEEEKDRIINCHCDGTDFHPILTPIMRAAQKNNYGIVKLLLDAGARISESKNERNSESTTDSLLQSVGLVERFEAIATPAYVTQAYVDPIEKAFKLTKELTQLSYVEVENKLLFQDLAKKMEQLAADLISEARNSNEILTVLKYLEKDDKKGVSVNRVHSFLPKIERAVKFGQKRFVASPNCQQAVSTQFHRHLVSMTDWSKGMQLLLIVGVILFHPIFAIGYKIGIGGNVKDFIQIPFIKFVMQFGSDIFLLSVMMARSSINHPAWEIKSLEIFILLTYATGIAVRQGMFFIQLGPKKFLTNFTHYREMIISTLLFVNCALEVIIIDKIRRSSIMDTDEDFVNLPWNDFAVISKTLFGLAVVVAFLRIMPYLISNDAVGAFQLSLGDMIVNTSHFFVVLLAVFVAFATGMTYLYGNTIEGSRALACKHRLGDCSDLKVHFDNIFQTVVTLYWSMYGFMGTDILQLPAEQQSLYVAGLTLFALFNILAILVLLNALIAIMSNVYNAIEENADVEWKFSRTVLWMSFMDDSFTVPPPFNLVPDFGALCSRLTKSLERKKHQESIMLSEMMRHEYQSVNQEEYQNVIAQIMDRYIANRLTSEQSATGDISPLDIRDLRNDVASLRFDITKQLTQMEESLTRGNQQGDQIFGQSREAKVVFDRTLEIDDMVYKYKAALRNIFESVEKYKGIVPTSEDLESWFIRIVPQVGPTVTVQAPRPESHSIGAQVGSPPVETKSIETQTTVAIMDVTPAPAPELDVTSAETQTPSADLDVTSAETQTPSADVDVTSAETQTPAADLAGQGVQTDETNVSSSETQTDEVEVEHVETVETNGAPEETRAPVIQEEEDAQKKRHTRSSGGLVPSLVRMYEEETEPPEKTKPRWRRERRPSRIPRLKRFANNNDQNSNDITE